MNWTIHNVFLCTTDWTINNGIEGTKIQHHTYPFFLNLHLLDLNLALHWCTLHLPHFLASPHIHIRTLHLEDSLWWRRTKEREVHVSGCEWDVFGWWRGGGMQMKKGVSGCDSRRRWCKKGYRGDIRNFGGASSKIWDVLSNWRVWV